MLICPSVALIEVCLFTELARVSSVLHDLVVELGVAGHGQRHECHQQMCQHDVGTKDLRWFS